VVRLSTFLAAAAAACLAGAPSMVHAAKPPPPPPVAFDAGPESFQQRMATDPPQNRVLLDMEIGSRAFWRDDLPAAKPALDDAMARINAVFDKDPNAAKARQLWYDEGRKDFKGEPYERAMVFAYRGLVFLREGDYENARAAFRQGQLQDAFAEEDQNRDDFALLRFLEAWASHANGDKDLADEAMKGVKDLRPDFGGFGEKDDTLILIETGRAPRKLGDGADHAFFVYRRGKPIAATHAQVLVGSATVPAYPMEDLYYQASTRGGREIDQVLQGKAMFKQTAGGIGSFLADTSVALSTVNSYSSGGGLGTASAVAGGIGGVFLIISSSTKPQADTRTWSALPDTIHVLTLATGGRPLDLKARFLLGAQPVEGLDKPIDCFTDQNGKRLCLVRAY
jgi:tetratricopeptide (TPR) repeat protein